MMEKDGQIFNRLSFKKSKIIEIGLIAIILALGIKLVGSYLFALMPLNWSLIIGILAILIGIFFLMVIKFEGLKNNYKYHGFLLRDKEKDEFIEVPRYKLSIEVSRIFDSVMSESIPLKKQWGEDSLNDFTQIKNNKTVGDTSLKSYRIVSEILEYIVLKEISMTLFTFYQGRNQEDIKDLKREDIPNILLNNRVFELLSKKPNDRDFNDAEVSENTLLYAELAFAKTDGENIEPIFRFYENFKLKLPTNCSINKNDEGYIVLNSRYFVLKIKLDYTPFSTALPQNFKKYYLKKEEPLKIHESLVICDVFIRLKLSSLVSFRGWRNYKWIDSLISTLKEGIDEKHFLQNIEWQKTQTLIRVFK